MLLAKALFMHFKYKCIYLTFKEILSPISLIGCDKSGFHGGSLNIANNY